MADPDPRRILVAGDWHGDTPRMRAAIHAAQVHGCDTVLHVGDLGILWPRVTPKTFDLPLVEELAKTGLGFYFVDGNHAALRGDYEPDESGFVEVLRGAWSAPRAHR
ncbi:metallophosphoesterase [Aeromicrobium sp.]|uniref:metallophosphoesterase n=1 Tax=Aeromicrobium sp. TaxID=1871063 RepID=UPI0019CA9BBF|nr:metallophosphoesterase [Aeromicrobium sp.]MBC7631342.1 metallophosphoesterase family protein [Aeromicrobium sp.]